MHDKAFNSGSFGNRASCTELNNERKRKTSKHCSKYYIKCLWQEWQSSSCIMQNEREFDFTENYAELDTVFKRSPSASAISQSRVIASFVFGRVSRYFTRLALGSLPSAPADSHHSEDTERERETQVRGEEEPQRYEHRFNPSSRTYLLEH